MKQADRIILVVGATGLQGGAVARHLLAAGWPLRALVRDPQKAAAQALANQGVELVQGDLFDGASLERAVDGVYGVFSVQNFWLPGVGAEGEVRQGILLADAASHAGVQHFVYSSVGGAERGSGIPHFESKWRIEQHIRALGLPATIIRPVAFMENYNWTRSAILAGSFSGFGLRPETLLQLIATDDIGAIAAQIFANPALYIGQALEIAGDELTEPAIAAVFSQVIGRPVRVVERGADAEDRVADAEEQKMLAWFNTAGYQADIPAVRAIHPGLITLEQYLRTHGWEQAREPVATGA